MTVMLFILLVIGLAVMGYPWMARKSLFLLFKSGKYTYKAYRWIQNVRKGK